MNYRRFMAFLLTGVLAAGLAAAPVRVRAEENGDKPEEVFRFVNIDAVSFSSKAHAAVTQDRQRISVFVVSVLHSFPLFRDSVPLLMYRTLPDIDHFPY